MRAVMAVIHPDTLVPHNLPRQQTPFIGREKAVEAVRELMRRPTVQLVTLTGPGGMGKTRLAIEIAASFLPTYGRQTRDLSRLTVAAATRHFTSHFFDAVYFVPLAALNDPDLVATSIAESMGIMQPDGGAGTLAESLKKEIGSRRLLLILDNMEQVLEASDLVADLTEGCPELKVIATSRERLRLRGEQEYVVQPLELPVVGTHPLPGELAEFESVRLFVDRATALRPDFRVTGTNAGTIAEICTKLDGMPLAIELAAARVKILSPEAILGRLERRLKLLTGGERDRPSRHRTLRAAIDWSYDLLDEREKAFFRRLSIFSGSGSLAAIEAVCTPQAPPEGSSLGQRHAYDLAVSAQRLALDLDPLDGITSMVDKSLLRQVEVEGVDPRFAMLETIGEYALEKLEESGETPLLQRIHALFFLQMAEQAEPELKGERQVEWLRTLESEHDNMRSALTWALGTPDGMGGSQGGDGEVALRLASALHGFWRMRGYFTEGRTWLERALSASSPKPTPERAKALLAEGTLASGQSDFVRARAALDESLALFRELGDMESVTSALRNLGNELRYRGDFKGSASAFEEALEIARELDKKWDIGSLLGDLGIVGQSERAQRMYEESLAIRRELNDTRGIAMMLVNLGELARAENRYAEAGELYAEALTLARQLEDKWGVGMVLHNMGHVAYHKRDYIHAWNLFAESLTIFHEMGNKRDIAYCLAALAGLFGARKQPERAAVLFSAANALSNTISSHLDPADQVEYERNLANTKEQMSQGEWDRAWVKGEALTLDEAVAYALETPPAPDQTKPLQMPRLTAPLGPITGPLGEDALLTDREVEVLQLVAEGLQDNQVAGRLSISPRTVHRHLSSIYSKLGVASRTAAVRIALERQLV
jgi:predicted ATPase/DNA-binding CsgD family transcriptional regulator